MQQIPRHVGLLRSSACGRARLLPRGWRARPRAAQDLLAVTELCDSDPAAPRVPCSAPDSSPCHPGCLPSLAPAALFSALSSSSEDPECRLGSVPDEPDKGKQDRKTQSNGVFELVTLSQKLDDLKFLVVILLNKISGLS
ncbi:hypothetical protein NDU88_010546 [Pleurodeles waltl]|uniref:Uncharacterized protein n=1 Tax=Pleurodeles waltl TaxID=8319 RepID=A0AAV7R0W0_PLEWA|nr:hypothetical protein NDU88_010546 [Pleurodeles waltl]